MLYTPRLELNLRTIGILLGEDLKLKKEEHDGYEEWRSTKFFLFEKQFCKIPHLTISPEHGILFYLHKQDKVELHARGRELLIDNLMISLEDLFNEKKAKIFDLGIAAHIEYIAIRQKAMKEQRQFIEYFTSSSKQ